MSTAQTLYCHVVGEDLQNVFPVKILFTETVSDLKQAIQHNSPLCDGFAANRLNLWKASTLFDSFVKKISESDFFDEDPLHNTSKLSDIFPEPLDRLSFNIIVKTPTMCEFDKPSNSS